MRYINANIQICPGICLLTAEGVFSSGGIIGDCVCMQWQMPTGEGGQSRRGSSPSDPGSYSGRTGVAGFGVSTGVFGLGFS